MTARALGRDGLARLAEARGIACEDVMRLGDLATVVACDRPEYRDAVLALFRTEAGQHRALDPADARARIVIFEADEADGAFAAAPPDSLEVTASGGTGRWTIATEALTAHLFAKPPIEMFLAVRGRPDDSFAFRVHLSVALHRALLLLDRVFLHAAGIRSGETCYAFMGDKGSGKSTLSLALGAAGAAVLADDHLVLRREGDRFLASGCDGEARLLEDAERHLFGAPVDARVVEFGGVRKKEIPVGRYFVSDPYREYQLDRLVFAHVGGAFGVRPITKRDALVGLIQATRSSHRFSGASDYGAYLDYLSSLVDSVETFALELSPDLSELGRLVGWVRDGAA